MTGRGKTVVVWAVSGLLAEASRALLPVLLLGVLSLLAYARRPA